MNPSTQLLLLPTGATRRVNDICASRHRGNAESKAANPSRASKADSHLRILKWIRGRQGSEGTPKEYAAAIGVELNTVSGRFSELKQLGCLSQALRKRRNGSAVLFMTLAGGIYMNELTNLKTK